jgi:hypothetical protein
MKDMHLDEICILYFVCVFACVRACVCERGGG